MTSLRENERTYLIRMAGVDVLPSAVAQLALRLHNAGELGLADYLGRAVDKLQTQISLREQSYSLVLSVLDTDLSPDLERLQAALRNGQN